MKRLIGRLTITTAVAAVCGALLASPAHAHDYQWQLPKGNGVMVISGNHTSISICDTFANGHSVSAEFWYRLAGHFDDLYRSISDTNGSAQGCGGWTAPVGGRIVAARGHSIAGDTGWVTP